MKKKVYLLIAAMSACMMFVSACGPSVAEMMEMYDQDMADGTFSRSVPHLIEFIQDDEDGSDEDYLLWRLMLAGAYAYQGKTEEAIKEFDFAEDRFLRNDKEFSFLAASSGYLVNERYFEFNGYGQDRIFTSLYKALSYAARNEKAKARTEFNRMMEHQENWLFIRRNEISKAAEKGNAALGASNDADKAQEAQKNSAAIFGNPAFHSLLAQHCKFDINNSGNLNKLRPEDYQNAYITHLCGVFRWLNGDGAVNYLRDAAKLNPGNTILAADAAEAAANVKPTDTVWFYVEDGLCPIREECRLDLPLVLIPYVNRYVLYAGMAIPAMIPRSEASQTYNIESADGIVGMTDLESIDRLMKTEYDVYMHGLVQRELTRCMMKVAPQVAAGIAADVVTDDYARLGLRAAQLAAAAYARASTYADLRSWRYLPKRVLLQKIKRPADGKITVAAFNAKYDFNVPEGNNIVWFRKPTASTHPSVQIINFQ